MKRRSESKNRPPKPSTEGVQISLPVTKVRKRRIPVPSILKAKSTPLVGYPVAVSPAVATKGTAKSSEIPEVFEISGIESKQVTLVRPLAPISQSIPVKSVHKITDPAPISRISETDAFLRLLIISGWLIALAYFPSGLLHHFLGAGVYLRDIFLGLHLIASIVWLKRHSQIQWVAAHSWIILIVPVMLIPAALDTNYRMEALRTCKWSLCWIDWIMLGHFLRLNKDWGKWGRTLVIVTMIELVLELIAGFIEWRTGDYLFKTEWGSTTPLGVMSGYDQYLDNQIRIRGLQRDVFSFANLMAMSAVAGFVMLTLVKELKQRLGWLAWALAFAGMVFVSGGRSSLFGVAAAGIYAGLCLLIPAFSRIFGRSYIIIWLAIAVVLSIYGVGHFTDFVGENLLSGTKVGDSTSAYMRDDFWSKMLVDFQTKPIILLIGGPYASLIDHQVDIMFHWADNQFLWNLYHTGAAGFLALIFYFYRVLLPEPTEKDWMIRRALIFFLVFVIGEGIARESMTFMGCLPLFILCGHYNCSQYRRQLFEPASNRHHQRSILSRWRNRK